MNQEKNNEEINLDQLVLEQKLNEMSLLRESLEDQKKKATEYYDQLLRLKAE